MESKVSISACPHDCPSTCALEILHDKKHIYEVKGASENSYTSGVVCAKTARYSERTHHPDRLLQPLMRVGEKGLNNFFIIFLSDKISSNLIDAYNASS